MIKITYKIPEESPDYPESSDYVIERVSAVIKASISDKRNVIFIRTNLKRGLPLENINKVAGPFVEAWAVEQFTDAAADPDNPYELINVEARPRLDIVDVVLQFKRKHDNQEYISANVDVKATAEDIATSGKSPNITSFAKVRSAYIEDPNYIFVILSLKHKVFQERDSHSGMTNGIMEVTAFSAYDLKYLSSSDLNYNPSLGTGQLQIRDIHYVTLEKRKTSEFVHLLDKKYIRSRGEARWLDLAKKYAWIKEEA